jgi:hypothetical protein
MLFLFSTVNVYYFIDFKQSIGSWVWWCTPVIPALGRWRHEAPKFKGSLSYVVNSRTAWTTWTDPVLKK